MPQAKADQGPIDQSTTSQKLPTIGPAQAVQLYLDATSSGDLDKVATLMLDASKIFESGSDEGTWDHYRSHHLGPELKAIATFAIRPGEKNTSTSADASLALVTLSMEYDIDLVSKRRIESRAVATFSLQLVDGEYKISHVHWSSRPRASAGAHLTCRSRPFLAARRRAPATLPSARDGTLAIGKKQP